jgi:carbon-monoxide dehydrogenase medium subunit
MKPAPFEYKAPVSLDQALELMSEHGDQATLLAGGQSLIPAMNFRVVQPTIIVDLNGIDSMAYVRTADGAVQIGAMTRQRALEHDQMIAERAPLLSESLPHIAHPQIRNRGTLGGSLVHADPAAELPVVALAREARFKLGNREKERWIDANDFFQGMFMTALEPDELLLEVEFPPLPDRTGWSFKELSRRRGDYAMMGVAAIVTLDQSGKVERARLVYLNAGDGPLLAEQASAMLVGEEPKEPLIDEAAAFASEKEIEPFGNVHASIEYQTHLAQVLTKRTLNTALDRARSNGKASKNRYG